VREDVCAHCKGTELSGISLVCEKCEHYEIHFHCMDPPLLVAPEGDWFCPRCCQTMRINFDKQVKEDQDTQVQKQLNSLFKGRNKKRKLSAGATDSLAALADRQQVDGVVGDEAPHHRPSSSSSSSSAGRRRTNAGNAGAGAGGSGSGSGSGHIEHVLLSSSIDYNNGFYHSSHSNGHLHANYGMHSADGYDNNFNSRVGVSGTPTAGKSQTNKRRKPNRFRDENGAIADDVSGLLSPSLRNYYSEIKESRHTHDHHIDGAETTSSKNRSRDSAENNTNTSEDDICNVCREGGKLILCDYPNCSRTYHQVCLMKKFPFSPETIDEHGIGAGFPSDIWFCPAHSCVICQALELPTSGPFKAHELPANLLQMHASFAGLAQRQLRSCSTCPQSVCTECEQGISNLGIEQRGRGRRAASDRDAVNMCTNCLAPTPLLKLGKLLERAVCRALRSRLSMLFCRPMLPIIGVSSGDSNDAAATEPRSATCAFLLDKPCPSFLLSMFVPEFWQQYMAKKECPRVQVNDLLDLLERVRELRFASIEEFLLALNTIMVNATEKLEAACEQYSDGLEDVRGSGIDEMKQHILTTLNSVMFLSLSFLCVHRETLYTVTNAISSAAAASSSSSAGSSSRNSLSSRLLRSGMIDLTPLGSVDKASSSDQVLAKVKNLLKQISAPANSVQSLPALAVVTPDGSYNAEDPQARTGRGRSSSSGGSSSARGIGTRRSTSPIKAEPVAGSSNESPSSKERNDAVSSMGLADESEPTAAANGVKNEEGNANDIPVSVRMWRLECDTVSQTSSSSSSALPRYHILPKTLLGWDAYIAAGVKCPGQGAAKDDALCVGSLTGAIEDDSFGLDFGSGSWIGDAKSKEQYVLDWVNKHNADRPIVSIFLGACMLLI
jgi:hypothetical protein